MTLAIVLVLVAVIALIIILRVAVFSGIQISGNGRLVRQIQPIDVEAFGNLVDAAEEDYLRRRLTSAEFRRVQRTRLRALATYVHVASRNAEVLIAAGQSALNSPDIQTAAAATEMVNNALLLRRNATFALIRIYLALAWPSTGFAAEPVIRGYQRLNGSAMLLGRLQNPAAPIRISAM